MWIIFLLISLTNYTFAQSPSVSKKTRVLVTSDGEVDDECSLVRFLLYANEWDIEGIVTSSSQYHWHGHKWAGDDWAQPYLEAYANVYPKLLQHDSGYPSPAYLQAHTFLGNVETEGEMDEITPGSQHIADVLLDESDSRPIWIQAWGGTNTIARALKTIEETHPEKMAYVANKIRFYFIWEQDTCYQSYIRPHWGKYNIPTIISDQFIAIFYHWKKYLPAEQQAYLVGDWMKQHILENHGPLCSLYKSHENGDFRSEGDSPAFLHSIPTGLRSLESPDWGGWGGRYIRVRENTWLDPVLDSTYQYPEGRWYGNSAWGRERLRAAIPNDKELTAYLKPMWRWTEAMQNDFASRADWCVKSYEEANHPPVVVLAHEANLQAKPGEIVKLSAQGTSDPDGDELSYRWWQYQEAGSYPGSVEIQDSGKQNASIKVPEDALKGKSIHLICEVTDKGSPQLTRYQRVVVEVAEGFSQNQLAFPGAEGYGKYTVGGRGGAVYEVTNLNDAGEGSLRAAVEASGPRTVVFRVSGTIVLASDLRIKHDSITIAGQTAPGGGIALRKYPLLIDASEVIIRYIRVRLGDESGDDPDAITSRYHKNIIIDHVSASWSVDETMSIYHGENITVQWCLISESLYLSNHKKGGNHGFGGIWGSNYGSYHHNLLAHHSSRNPRFASGCGNTDYRNNVVYNWGYKGTYGGEVKQVGNSKFNFSNINMVANYYKPGPATELGEASYQLANPWSRNKADDYGKWYIAENVMEGNAAVTADNWNGGVQAQDGPSYLAGLKLEQAWPAMAIRQQTAEEAYASVLQHAGASLPQRDAVDTRIVDEVRKGYATYEGQSYEKDHTVADSTQKCGIIDSQEEVGGWPELKNSRAPRDKDHDGMPDKWEKQHGLNPRNAADRNELTSDGYTMLEKYLNEIE